MELARSECPICSVRCNNGPKLYKHIIASHNENQRRQFSTDTRWPEIYNKRISDNNSVSKAHVACHTDKKKLSDQTLFSPFHPDGCNPQKAKNGKVYCYRKSQCLAPRRRDKEMYNVMCEPNTEDNPNNLNCWLCMRMDLYVRGMSAHMYMVNRRGDICRLSECADKNGRKLNVYCCESVSRRCKISALCEYCVEVTNAVNPTRKIKKQTEKKGTTATKSANVCEQMNELSNGHSLTRASEHVHGGTKPSEANCEETSDRLLDWVDSDSSLPTDVWLEWLSSVELQTLGSDSVQYDSVTTSTSNDVVLPRPYTVSISTIATQVDIGGYANSKTVQPESEAESEIIPILDGSMSSSNYRSRSVTSSSTFRQLYSDDDYVRTSVTNTPVLYPGVFPDFFRKDTVPETETDERPGGQCSEKDCNNNQIYRSDNRSEVKYASCEYTSPQSSEMSGWLKDDKYSKRTITMNDDDQRTRFKAADGINTKNSSETMADEDIKDVSDKGSQERPSGNLHEISKPEVYLTVDSGTAPVRSLPPYLQDENDENSETQTVERKMLQSSKETEEKNGSMAASSQKLYDETLASTVTKKTNEKICDDIGSASAANQGTEDPSSKITALSSTAVSDPPANENTDQPRKRKKNKKKNVTETIEPSKKKSRHKNFDDLESSSVRENIDEIHHKKHKRSKTEDPSSKMSGLSSTAVNENTDQPRKRKKKKKDKDSKHPSQSGDVTPSSKKRKKSKQKNRDDIDNHSSGKETAAPTSKFAIVSDDDDRAKDHPAEKRRVTYVKRSTVPVYFIGNEHFGFGKIDSKKWINSALLKLQQTQKMLERRNASEMSCDKPNYHSTSETVETVMPTQVLEQYPVPTGT